MFGWETETGFKIDMKLNEKRCQVTISGGLDRVACPPLVSQFLNKVWQQDIDLLEIDCRELFSAWHSEGLLSTYFLVLIIIMEAQAFRRKIKLIFYFKSRKQITVATLPLRGLEYTLFPHFRFDDPD